MISGNKNSSFSKENGNAILGGKIMPFTQVCPDGGDKVWVLTARGVPDLPDDNYRLIDAYCAVPECDCRVAYIFVVRQCEPDEVLASTNFGWESLQFYKRFIKKYSPNVHASDLKGPTLIPWAPQSHIAPVLLEFLSPILQKPQLERSLRQRYHRFKAALLRMERLQSTQK